MSEPLNPVPPKTVHRPWLDVHPKVMFGFFVVVALFAVAMIVEVLSPDIFLETKELLFSAIGGFLVLLVAYFKPGDGK